MEWYEANWIDITACIQNDMVHWPGEIPVKIQKSSAIQNGDEANVTALKFSAHTGTHIDAENHFFSDGEDTLQIPMSRMIGPVTIFQVKDEHQITLKEIKSFLIRSGDRIIFKTKNSDIDWVSEPFNKNYISLDTDAAVYLSEIGISCIGVDYLSVAQFDHAAEVHRTLLEKKILIIEGLILFNVIPGKYEMICLPLKIKDADGAPARVLLKKINIR